MAASTSASIFEPLVVSLTQQEQPVSALIQRLHGENLKSMNSVRDSITSTRSFLEAVGGGADGALTLTAIGQVQAHVQITGSLLQDLDRPVQSDAADDLLTTYERERGNFVDQVNRILKSLTKLPGKPKIGPISVEIGQVTVSWTPSRSGGNPVGYVITYTTGDTTIELPPVSGGTTSTVVVGLANGGVYTFSVAAIGAAGRGDADSSGPVTLPSAPGQPTITAVTPGIRQATVSWNPPADSGGQPVGAYAVTATPSDGTPPIGLMVLAGACGGNPPTCGATVAGLVNGGRYTFTVAAANAVGLGQPSAPFPAASQPPIMLADVPGAPTITGLTPDVGQVTVTWDAPPGAAGALPILGYVITYSYDDGTAPNALILGVTATSATVTGLTGGSVYQFTVSANNAAGWGQPSGKVSITTPSSASSTIDRLLADLKLLGLVTVDPEAFSSYLERAHKELGPLRSGDVTGDEGQIGQLLDAVTHATKALAYPSLVDGGSVNESNRQEAIALSIEIHKGLDIFLGDLSTLLGSPLEFAYASL